MDISKRSKEMEGHFLANSDKLDGLSVSQTATFPKVPIFVLTTTTDIQSDCFIPS